jgi:2-C-methyl-D-erythritol 4-phosphate cytidylyltransferase
VTRVSETEASHLSAVVPLDGRGGLVFESLHGQPLYLSAVRTLSAVVPSAVVRVEPGALPHVRAELAAVGSPARVLDADSWWEEVRRGPARPLLVHDPLCPLAPADLVAGLVARTRLSPASLVAVRPVTDTVKTAAEGRITGTIDRRGLVVVSSPVVVAATVMEQAVADDDRPPLADMARMTAWLRARGPVETVQAPSLARRVDDASSVLLLECVDELHHQLRQT